MGAIYETRRIRRSASQVWAWLSDYGNIQRIHPRVRHSYVVGDQTSGVGAVRVCEMGKKDFIKERVTGWKDAKEYTVEMVESSMPLKWANATLGVRPIDKEQSEVFMRMAYEMKFGPLGAVLDRLMLRPMMRKTAHGIFQALESASHAL